MVRQTNDRILNDKGHNAINAEITLFYVKYQSETIVHAIVDLSYCVCELVWFVDGEQCSLDIVYFCVISSNRCEILQINECINNGKGFKKILMGVSVNQYMYCNCLVDVELEIIFMWIQMVLFERN